MINNIYLILVLSLSFAARADETDSCDKLAVFKNTILQNNTQQLERYTLTQFGFEQDVRDLAIIVHNVNLPAQIRRVTFNRGQAYPACYFKPLAFVQGGQNSQNQAAQYWGWHLLWSEGDNKRPQGLFYARIDGEAWVSSNPKRLTKLMPFNTQFKLNKDTIIITWQQTENGVTANMQALSNDEGRSWDITSLQP